MTEGSQKTMHHNYTKSSLLKNATLSFPLVFFVHLLFCVIACKGDDGFYYQQYFEACADSEIEVEDLSLLCDSPGAYYYGNGKYRNSNTCMFGDKGHVSVYFYVGEELMGAEPYVSLKVRDESNAAALDMYIYDDELLCSIGSLVSQDGQDCPGEGFYHLSGTTYLGDKDGSGDCFDAVTTVGFRTDPSVGYFDLGGANTDHCEGGSYGRYSYVKMRKQVASAIASFLITWGTLLFGIVSVTCIVITLTRKIRTRNEVPFDDADEDLLDGHYNQVIVMSSSRSLVDF